MARHSMSRYWAARLSKGMRHWAGTLLAILFSPRFMDRPNFLDCVGLEGRFIFPVTLYPGKPQGQASRVPWAFLDIAVSDFYDKVWSYRERGCPDAPGRALGSGRKVRRAMSPACPVVQLSQAGRWPPCPMRLRILNDRLHHKRRRFWRRPLGLVSSAWLLARRRTTASARSRALRVASFTRINSSSPI